MGKCKRGNSDISGRRGNRDIERPENAPVERFQWFERLEICPVDRFQRERVGRPLSMGPAGPNNREQEKPRAKRYNQDKGNVSAIK